MSRFHEATEAELRGAAHGARPSISASEVCESPVAVGVPWRSYLRSMWRGMQTPETADDFAELKEAGVARQVVLLALLACDYVTQQGLSIPPAMNTRAVTFELFMDVWPR